MAKVVVVGLGPGGPDLVTIGTRELISRAASCFVRTERHPAVAVVGAATSFDRLYEQAATLEEVYDRIVDELARAGRERGEVLYAVPGSPVVAERSVELLRERASSLGLEVEIHPALSFLDLAWVRLGIDPVAAGVRVVDGQRFAVEAAGERGPLLVAQCDSAPVLSDIKLSLDAGVEACLSPGTTVTVLQRLGCGDERIFEVPWVELDRSVTPDHMTSLYVRELDAPVAREIERVAELVSTLRHSCPWDRAQTHRSLTRHLLEETYEVLDAIDALDEEAGQGYGALEEELGDLLFQVLFHAELAAEAGQFTLADVAHEVYVKLYARHPHVFGDVSVSTPDDVARNWEQIKKAEKGRKSVFEGIPDHLPALLYALKVQKKAATLAELGVGVTPPPTISDALAAVREVPDAEHLGELLFAIVDLARRHDIDPETALRAAAVHHRDAARAAEQG